MVKVKLYVEGGGDAASLRNDCRRAFRMFLEKAGLKGRMPRIIACGSRQEAFSDFKKACQANVTALLLVDSEDFVTATSPWEHHKNRSGDSVVKPPGAQDKQCHFMVVCMESWFLADKDTLADYFGQGFNIKALPHNPNIESIHKDDVYKGLQAAIAHCKTKGKNSYSKGNHAFAVLERIDPEKVRAASYWANEFIKTLEQYMA